MQDSMTNGAMVWSPPWQLRLWHALGFRHARAPRFDEPIGIPVSTCDGLRWVGEPLYAPGCLVVGSYVRWSWGDRLRILLTGLSQVELAIRTDVLVRYSAADADATVPPP